MANASLLQSSITFRVLNLLPEARLSLIKSMLQLRLRISVCRDYYRDTSFCRQQDGTINLWRLYNLFTGANKSTYIDQFLDRSVNALDFAVQVQDALEGRSASWYLN